MYYIKGKGYFEESGKPVGSKRKIDLALARIAGHSNDTATLTRLVIESRVSMEKLKEAFCLGREQARNMEVAR